LKAIKRTTAQLEVSLTSSIENKELLQMFDLSESLVYYHDAIESNGTVLAKLKNRSEKFPFTPRQLALLDDAILENAQCAQQANIYSNVLAGLMDARGTIINNNMNVLLKNLTIINVVFLPLGLVASIGGMSEYTRLAEEHGWNLFVGYSLFCVAMVVIGFVMWALLRRRNGTG
jgi:magnesium transporter